VADRPAPTGADGAPTETEITPAMVRAGVRYLLRGKLLEVHEGSVSKAEFVRQMFSEMENARPSNDS
jgi:hypothetical protein